MTKKVLIAILAVLLVFGLASCSDGGNSGGGSSEPKRPAELSVTSFTENYPVGTEKPSGALLYTSTEGKITPVDINDAGVTTNFDAKTAGTNKLLKITYKGIDAVKYYNVVEPQKVDITGTFIVDKNTTLTFSTDTDGKLKVTKEAWTDWYQFNTLATMPTPEKLEYTIGISPSGNTVIRTNGWSYMPKDGGLAGYPSESTYFEYGSEYTPDLEHFYVSTGTEDNRSTTNKAAKGKYLVMAFDAEGSAYFWFTSNVDQTTLEGLNIAGAVKIPANKMSFDQAGVNFKNVTIDEGSVAVEDKKASNLAIILNRDHYASTTRAFGFVSSSDGAYKGYSYTMKLSDVVIPVNFFSTST